MANYPLKNIAIGNDVYEIQSGDKSYRVTLRAILNDTSVSISSMTVKEILETYRSSIRWSIVGIYKLGPGGDSYDPSQTMIDDLIGMKYYQAQYEFRGSDTTKRGNFISWSPEDEQACSPMFGIIDYDSNPPIISGLVTVSVDTEQNLVSNMCLSDFGGGGGGSSALHTLSIYKNGGEIPFTNLTQSDTVELYDISTSPALTLDNTGLTNIIKASPVVVKDDTFYGYISSWNTAYKELSLIYTNSTQMYMLTLTHQWNANWQVTGNKRLVTQ